MPEQAAVAVVRHQRRGGAGAAVPAAFRQSTGGGDPAGEEVGSWPESDANNRTG